jgi:formylglycine-generating enzyme required for sulfatase activity
MAQTPITYQLWTSLHQWAVRNGYYFKNEGMKGSTGSGDELQPVTMLSWQDAVISCNALTEYYNLHNCTSLKCVYKSMDGILRDSRPENIGSFNSLITDTNAKGFRLPTSMEWELAARYIDGNVWTPDDYASGSSHNYQDKTATQRVACYEDNSNMTTCPVKSKEPNALNLYDMAGNVWEWCFNSYGEHHRIARGGSCYDIAFVLQSGFFISCDPSYAHNSFSFRTVRNT